MNQKKKIITWSALLLVVIGVSYVVLKNNTQLFAFNRATDLNKILELDKKEAGTKVYYSEKLGVAFTYSPDDSHNPEIIESENKIMVDDQEIQVFAKDPADSLQQAIEKEFLKDYDSANCFVKGYQFNSSEQKPASYSGATISFPPASDPNDPWWKNSDKCPQPYSETNGLQYFLTNSEVPGKFVFVKLGQAPVVSDGTISDGNMTYNWSHSLRIIK